MSFEIYFDESNKLDKKEGKYSYYGIIGWDSSIREKLDIFMAENSINQELHFSKFNLDKVDKYLKVIEFALDKIEANFYIVNKDEAFRIASETNIAEDMLRKLFYMKIPERLIYGMTRKIGEYKNIEICIDKSDEYGNEEDQNICNDSFVDKLINICGTDRDVQEKNKSIKKAIGKLLKHIQLPDTLKYQLNAQALYRGLNYSIDTVKQIDSKNSNSLQVIDVLLGIIRFLYEEEYLEPNNSMSENEMSQLTNHPRLSENEVETFKKCYKNNQNQGYSLNQDIYLKNKDKIIEIGNKIDIYSKKNVQRSEFIHRLLKDKDMLMKICNFRIFLWENESVINTFDYDLNKNSKEVIRHDLSRHVAKFISFKNQYDEKNKLAIISYLRGITSKEEMRGLKESDFRAILNFNGSLKNLIRRYLEELDIEALRK